MNSHWIEIKKWRQFGWLVGSIFMALSGLKSPPVQYVLLGTGATLFLMASIFPPALKVPYQLWMKLGMVLGEINSRILLAGIFFLLLTPMALVRRLLKKNDFKEFRNQKAVTYRKVSIARDPSHFETQF